MLKACLSTLQGFLFPASCVLCGKPGDGGRELCAECLVDLPYNPHACQRCAIPLPGPFALCGQCQTTTPPYDAAISIFRYDYPLDHLIQRLKFSAKLHLATLLGELMAEHLHHAAGTLPELLIPVPLHTARLRERGFNQALELARPIARALQRPLDYRSCVRLRATKAQSLLPAKEKRANVKNAFGVVRPIEARHVAIIDDVMTTGHTVQELAGIVRKAGVERIDVWVLARASFS